ncbi:Leucine rich repeat protein [Scheffersomyces stipitis CBS 6054]|uniref:Leucine rich repeat protein n=1 Tax=Scheffersomyces stipitis (strain ATCC 58785 / CBS 6054 / NBRC 10063 / NRRL Y-11545) TaxID=322104 RepID=A3GI47_PICST|nr:Leucine rich repeat protein [Scheffersomyces stipitis CBS 6054]EAZ62924.2 Leucine rich repeat protein [Scheffersomyces stipitis CBS 6054]
MESFVLHLDRFPLHIVESIICHLPFRLALAVVSNGSSPYQHPLLNAVYRNIEVNTEEGYDDDPLCMSLERLRKRYLLDSAVASVHMSVYIPVGNFEVVAEFIDRNTHIHVQNLRVIDEPSKELFTRMSTIVQRVKKLSFETPEEFDEASEQAMLEYTLPANLYGLHTFDFHTEMYMPLHLSKLELQIFSFKEDIIQSLPPSLESLSIILHQAEPFLLPDEMALLPKTIKSLQLEQCLVLQGKGEITIDFPNTLQSFTFVAYENFENLVLDLSNLINLTDIDINGLQYNLPLSAFKLPASIENLQFKSGLLSEGMYQIEELSKLKQLSLFRRPKPQNNEYENELNSSLFKRVVLPSGLQQFIIQDGFGISSQGCNPLLLRNFDLPKDLARLSLANCTLHAILEHMSKLTDLSLTSVGTFDQLSTLQTLTKLRITNSKIPLYFWEDVLHMASLRNLEVSFCELKGFPLKLPERLERLNLGENNITEVNVQLPYKLFDLKLCRNFITSFIIIGESKLRNLDLDINKLTEINNTTFQIPGSVKELSLRTNPITTVHKDFTFPREIRFLYLNRTSIVKVEEVLAKLPPQIVELEMDSKRRVQDGDKPKSIRVSSPTLWKASIMNCLVDCEIIWEDCSNLEYIDMSYNTIEVIRVETFPLSLKSLRLKQCGLREVEGDFYKLPNLLLADLRNNNSLSWSNEQRELNKNVRLVQESDFEDDTESES